ncbi:MAG: hypothetical protein WDW38_008400 [Sanguina aurantia]
MMSGTDGRGPVVTKQPAVGEGVQGRTLENSPGVDIHSADTGPAACSPPLRKDALAWVCPVAHLPESCSLCVFSRPFRPAVAAPRLDTISKARVNLVENSIVCKLRADPECAVLLHQLSTASLEMDRPRAAARSPQGHTKTR